MNARGFEMIYRIDVMHPELRQRQGGSRGALCCCQARCALWRDHSMHARRKRVWREEACAILRNVHSTTMRQRFEKESFEAIGRGASASV